MEIWTAVGKQGLSLAAGDGIRDQRENGQDRFAVILERADGTRKKLSVSPEEYEQAETGRMYTIKDGRLYRFIQVVAAVIIRDHSVFATQRGYGEQKDKWEFPGGKIEKGESPEAALVREIREELAATVQVERFLTQIEFDYPNFHLSMGCYLCSVTAGELILLEHEAAAWLTSEELERVEWLPADVLLLEEVRKILSE